MARISIGDKARRVLTFLHGLTNPRAASVLAAFGFTQRDLDEGWQLLRELRSVRLSEQPPMVSPRSLRELDEWENLWLAVSKASLERHHPDIHAKVFLNLSQTSGLDVINSVGTFLERIKELESASDADSKAARKLLHRPRPTQGRAGRGPRAAGRNGHHPHGTRVDVGQFRRDRDARSGAVGLVQGVERHRPSADWPWRCLP